MSDRDRLDACEDCAENRSMGADFGCPTHSPEAYTTIYRCGYCGQFYSMRTAQNHRMCQRLEDREAAGL